MHCFIYHPLQTVRSHVFYWIGIFLILGPFNNLVSSIPLIGKQPGLEVPTAVIPANSDGLVLELSKRQGATPTITDFLPQVSGKAIVTAVPSVEECKQYLTEPETDQSLFYTGGIYESARTFADDSTGNLVLLEDIIQIQPPDIWAEDLQIAFWANCSQAYAEITSGTAFVVIPPTRPIPGGGYFWINFEYPALVQNIEVDMITKVDSVTFDESVLWPCDDPSGDELDCPGTVIS
jgi:hypothetical protein